MKRRMTNGDEYDAFTRWRAVHIWQPGQLKRIKRRAGKRERRDARAAIARGES